LTSPGMAGVSRTTNGTCKGFDGPDRTVTARQPQPTTRRLRQTFR
jgi:hypothetical protein